MARFKVSDLDRLKELEKEIVETMKRAMDDGVITQDESKQIHELLDKLNDMILEDDIVSLDEMKVVDEIYNEAMRILKKRPKRRKRVLKKVHKSEEQ